MHDEDFNDALHIADCLDIFYKRKMVFFVVFMLGLFPSVLYTYYAVPVYESTSTIMIEKERPTSPITGQRMEYESYQSETLTFNTHFKLILSKNVIQQVINVLNLDAKAPEGTDENHIIYRVKKRGAEYWQNIKDLLNTGEKPPRTSEENANSLIADIRANVSIEGIGETRLLKIRVKDKDPEQAALIANAFADQYIGFNLSNQMKSSKKNLEWMNNELYALKNKLEKDEKTFFDFMQANKFFSIAGKHKMADQKLKEFNSNYLATRHSRLDIDTKIREIEKHAGGRHGIGNIRSLVENPEISTVYAKVKDLEIQYAKLSKIYKNKHPKIIEIRDELDKNAMRLKEELIRELASLKAKRTVLYSREKVLKETLKEFEQDALNTSGNELEYSRLQRNMNTSKHLYDTLLAKIKESDILKTNDTSNIRLVEGAMVPHRPVSPNKIAIILIGVTLGVVGGVFFVALFEYMDQTIRTEEDVQKNIGIPVLSVIPIASKSVDYGSKS